MQTGRILIADDNALVRACIANLLQKWGLHFILCEDGQQAWKMLKKKKFDLLLLDLQMPIMDGYVVTNKLRNSKKNPNNSIPIVALAGSDDPSVIEQIINAGVNDIIYKPLAAGSLFKAISSLSIIPTHKKVRFFSDELNTAKLDALYGGDQDHIATMLKLFLKNTPSALQQMNTAIEEGDMEELRKVVHKLKPSFSMVGLPEVTKQAYRFEQRLQQFQKTIAIKRDYMKFSKSIEKALEVVNIEQKKLLISIK